MSEDRIEIGDTVTVYWGRGVMITGVVRSVPHVFGECWIIADSNRTHYVQQFQSICKDVS